MTIFSGCISDRFLKKRPLSKVDFEIRAPVVI